MWILQSSPVPRAGDADIAPAGCIPWIDTRTIFETGQWPLSLFKVSPHPMSRIMVKAAYLYRIPLSTPSGMIQFRCLPVFEHLTFLDRFGLFFPPVHFLSFSPQITFKAVKLYSPQDPVTSISTAE